MAKRIEGITIEIDGNTTGLSKALAGVNKNINSVNSELRQVNSLLKMDPGNSDLIAQKQKLLSNAIEETSAKLKTLRETKEQADKQFANGELGEEQYRALEREIIKTEQSLNGMNDELRDTNKVAGSMDLGKLSKGLADVGKKAGEVALQIGKVALKTSAAVGTALVALVGKGIQMSGELEQQLGGTEAVFGDFAGKVQKMSKEAFSTAGISANDYMATINKMGSLMQGSGIEQEKAMELSAKAMQRAADVASIMGIDINSAMESIAGAAKGNFSMMDNLGVAMNATALEAFALSKGIDKSYNSMTKAEQVGLAMEMFLEQSAYATGNYAKENETFAGSLQTLKASFDNFMSGAGDISSVIDSVVSFGGILVGKIVEMAPKIINGIITLIKKIVPLLPNLIQSVLPTLISGIVLVIQGLMETLPVLIETLLPSLITGFVELLDMFIGMLPEMLPVLLKALIDSAVMLVIAIAEALPEMLPDIIDAILSIIPLLIDNLPLFIDAGFKLIGGLVKGIINSVPRLLSAAGDIVKTIWGEVKQLPTKLLQVGKDLMTGLWNGIKEKWENLKSKVTELGEGIVNKFKSVFGIKSPSKIMEKEVGLNLGLGIAKGIDDSVGKVQDAMGRLTSGVTASVNPIINPTANSNPLILNIENFNNTRETDVQALMEEAEFYRKNTATAVGGR